MNALSQLFNLLASAFSLYSTICFIRIILTWIPGLSYSRFGQFLASVCDPYLNLFRGIRWLHFGSFDFSPALALCLLSAGNSICTGLAAGAYLSVRALLGMALNIIFTILDSLIIFILILFVVRLIMIIVRGDNSSSGFVTDAIDRSICPIVYKVAKIFSLGRPMTYKLALIISCIVLVALKIGLTVCYSILFGIIIHLPL